MDGSLLRNAYTPYKNHDEDCKHFALVGGRRRCTQDADQVCMHERNSVAVALTRKSHGIDGHRYLTSGNDTRTKPKSILYPQTGRRNIKVNAGKAANDKVVGNPQRILRP